MINVVSSISSRPIIHTNNVMYRKPVQRTFAQATNYLKSLHTTFIKLTKEEIRQAKGMSKEAAAKFYFDLICDRMAFPKELRPAFEVSDWGGKLSASCSFGRTSPETIRYYRDNKANNKFGNWWTFGLMRHEIEHYRQSIDIIRNKDIFKQEYKRFGEDYAKKSLEFRKKILKYYPEIDKSSKEYKKSLRYYRNQENYISPSSNNVIRKLRYFLQPVEFDACKTQGLNWINYFKTAIFG